MIVTVRAEEEVRRVRSRSRSRSLSRTPAPAYDDDDGGGGGGEGSGGESGESGNSSRGDEREAAAVALPPRRAPPPPPARPPAPPQRPQTHDVGVQADLTPAALPRPPPPPPAAFSDIYARRNSAGDDVMHTRGSASWPAPAAEARTGAVNGGGSQPAQHEQAEAATLERQRALQMQLRAWPAAVDVAPSEPPPPAAGGRTDDTAAAPAPAGAPPQSRRASTLRIVAPSPLAALVVAGVAEGSNAAPRMRRRASQMLSRDKDVVRRTGLAPSLLGASAQTPNPNP